MPARRQDVLHFLWPLIDRLVPGQAALLAKRGHRLDQLIDLRIEQMLPIAGLKIFYLVGDRAQIPVSNRHGIGCPMNHQAQVVGLARNHKIQRVYRRPKE